MSNTASPRKISTGEALRAWLAGFSRAQVATFIATLLFTVSLTSFRPLSVEYDAVEGGGDIVNQLGYGSLGALALFGLLTLVNRRRAASVFGFWWLAVFFFLLLSALNAPDPEAALRSVTFTLISLFIIAAVLTLPPDAEAFRKVLLVSGAVVIGLSYFGVLFMPEAAIHGPSVTEPENEGFWRGVFLHKNLAGPVMACYCFAGIYLFRSGWRTAGTLLFCAAFLFMANTGSKTTAGLVPLTILIVAVPGIIGMRGLTPWLIGLATLGTALGTLGLVFVPPLHHLWQTYFPELTFTGRTTLWEFSGSMIAKRPWTGYGYESFWQTPVVTGLDQFFDQDWDIRNIVHGHNSYMDIALTMGLPALFVVAMAVLVQPLRNFARIPLFAENIRLGDFFMMATLFTTLNAFLESFILRRVDPVWLFCALGVLGLRMVARFPVAGSARG